MNSANCKLSLGRHLSALFIALLAGLPCSGQFDPSSVYRVDSESGHGSGFLVDAERGLIVTNYHVIKLGSGISRHISVAKHEGHRYEALVASTDARKDLAVLQVSREAIGDSRPVRIPDRESTEVLDEVVAFGSPLTLGLQMTVGHISNLGTIAGTGDFLIQPGNSGGPVIGRESGELVGVSTFGVGGAAGFVRVGPVRNIVGKVPRSDVEPSPNPLPEPSLPGPYPAELLEERIRSAYEDRKPRRICENDFGRHAFGLPDQWCNEVNNDRFAIQVNSPVSNFYQLTAGDWKRDDNRQRRRGRKIDDETYRRSLNFYDWYDEARADAPVLDPVVTIYARPRTAETGGSIAKGIVSGALFGHTLAFGSNYKFTGEFHSMRVFAGERELEPVRRMRVLVAAQTEGMIEMRDEAFNGTYMYDLKDFAEAREIVIEVYDARKPSRPTGRRYELSMSDMVMKQIRGDYNALKQWVESDNGDYLQ